MAEMEIEMGGRSEVSVSRSVQLWRGLIDWMAFFIETLVQIMKGTPTLISYIVDLSSIKKRSLSASSSMSFKPLPVVEFPVEDSPVALATADFSVDDTTGDGGDNGDHALQKLTVVLDLDETLVCAYETCTLPDIIRTQAKGAGLKLFELECLSSATDCDRNPKINHVTVFERPGLHHFLRQLSEFADIVLFTAGLEGYAGPLVDKLDMENRFSLRLFRSSTVCTEYQEHVKDLSCLSKDLSRVVIVDNNPFSFLLQPLNGIPCIPFSCGQPHDNQLLEVLLPFLKHLALEKDVRPVLHKRFHMPEWYQMHGIPASGFTDQK